MSFIAVTYGYNQYSIFNINCTTLPLIDNIIKACLASIRAFFPQRKDVLANEISVLNTEEDSLNKLIAKLEFDRQKEEDRQEEARKLAEAELKKSQDPKAKKKEPAKPQPKGKNDTNAIQYFNDEITKHKASISTISQNRSKYEKKIVLLKDLLTQFNEMNETKMQIDLLDSTGQRVELETKDNSYANTYLIEKQCYELVVSKISKLPNNLSINSDDKNEQIFEPLKYDGYAVRTLDEDMRFEEMEKSGKIGKKQVKKK